MYVHAFLTLFAYPFIACCISPHPMYFDYHEMGDLMQGPSKLFNDFLNAIDHRHLDARDDKGETQLYRAARAGNIHDVKKLLKSGANPNIKNNKGLSALHQAAYWGETEMVEALLKHGANAKQNTGWSPLHSAALSGGMKSRAEIIGMLKSAGATDDAKDKHGWTPKDYMQLWQDNAPAAENIRQLMLDMKETPMSDATRKTPAHAFNPARAMKPVF